MTPPQIEYQQLTLRNRNGEITGGVLRASVTIGI